jgi:phosphoribosylformylglycinamidine cyclo-ligase
MPKNFTYDDAGVNRERRHESKKALKKLERTFPFSRYGKVLHLPYSNIFPYLQNTYLDLVIEGVGTKVLLAELAQKYDTIGIDAVAMAVNDVIRSGATPLAISDNIHAQASDPELVNEWLEGITEGAIQAECPVTSGEIGDVAEIINGITPNAGFDMIVAAIGQVAEKDVITGKNIKPEDQIIALPSSGLHSNGITLARKILLKQWGGKHETYEKPEGLQEELVLEMLKPTKIYVKPLIQLTKEVKVKAAVHITGDGYLKFNNLVNHSPGIGFKFSSFKPQPIFALIQDTAKQLGFEITDEEMFKTFNMGWGFAVIVDEADTENTIDILSKEKEQPEIIGKITTNERAIEILSKSKKILLS